MFWTFVILCPVLAFVLGDALHALARRWQARAWERRQKFPDGVREGCEAFSAGAGELAILLIPGFADNPSVFRHLAPRLAQAGFHCRAMRLPGAAEPMAVRRQVPLAAWRQAIDAEIAALRQTHARIWILGHSMGGTLAAEAAARHPEVAGLVLLAPMVKVATDLSPLRIPIRFWHRTLWRALLFSRTFKLLLPSEIRRDELVVQLHLDLYFPRSLVDNAMALAEIMPAIAPRIRCPVFLNATRRDSVIDTPAALEWLEQTAASAKATVIENEPSHVLPLDLGWEGRADRIAAFIQARANG